MRDMIEKAATLEEIEQFDDRVRNFESEEVQIEHEIAAKSLFDVEMRSSTDVELEGSIGNRFKKLQGEAAGADMDAAEQWRKEAWLYPAVQEWQKYSGGVQSVGEDLKFREIPYWDDERARIVDNSLNPVGRATTCDRLISSDTAKNGTFQSPNWPNPYPAKTRCTFHFTGRGRERIQILFSHFDLQVTSDSPKSSTVRESYTSTCRIGALVSTTYSILCGISSNQRYLYHSLSSNIVRSFPLLPFDVQPTLLSKQELSDKITYFNADSTPFSYDRYLWLNAPNDFNSSCDIASSLTVYITINGERSRINDFCGKTLPPKLMSNGPTMTIDFSGMINNTRAQGFKAIYRFVSDFGVIGGRQDEQSGERPPSFNIQVLFVYMICSYYCFLIIVNHISECGFVYNSTESKTGQFTSPNHPGFYPRDTECHYFFHGRPGERVQLTFSFFDVEGVLPCSSESASDYLEFSNFRTVDRKLARVCGNNRPDSYKSDGDFFRVTFKSNDRLDGRGFSAIYQFMNATVTDNLEKRKKMAASTPGNSGYSS
ncbi:Suppressor of lurcher protein 1 [Nymphon striatum]|nr:Suppressor of lurcher protein 1 [Nymphon striatum]